MAMPSSFICAIAAWLRNAGRNWPSWAAVDINDHWALAGRETLGRTIEESADGFPVERFPVHQFRFGKGFRIQAARFRS